MVANVWKQYSNQGAPQLDKPLPFPPLGARNELDSNFSLASVLPMNGSDVDTRSEFMKRTSATENPSQPTVSWKYPTLIGPHATMTSFGANERLGWSLQSLCDTTSALIARGLSHSFWGKRRGGGWWSSRPAGVCTSGVFGVGTHADAFNRRRTTLLFDVLCAVAVRACYEPRCDARPRQPPCVPERFSVFGYTLWRKTVDDYSLQ